VGIFAEVPRRGRQTTVGLSKTAIFSIFDGYFSDTLEMRPALLYGDMQSVVGFSVIPKCMTLSDPERVCLAETMRLRETISVKKGQTHTVSGANLWQGL